jgi:hypothetical protein
LTIEECPVELDVDLLVGPRGVWSGEVTTGELAWRDNTSMSFTLARDDDLRLTFAVENTVEIDGAVEEVAEVIRFTTVVVGSGGLRHLFACPRCGDRRKKLYVPPGQSRIGCRSCWDLTSLHHQRHDNRVAVLRRDPERLRAILESPEEHTESERYLAMRAVASR